jgi:hypothetical protein
MVALTVACAWSCSKWPTDAELDELVRSCAAAGSDATATPASKVAAAAMAIFDFVFISILSVRDNSEGIHILKTKLEKPVSLHQTASWFSEMRVVWELPVRESASALVPNQI